MEHVDHHVRARTGDLIALIDDLRADNRSGAAELLRRAATVFSHRPASPISPSSIDTVIETVIEIAGAIARSQPHMAPLTRLASAVVEAVCTVRGGDDPWALAETGARNYAELAVRASAAAAAHAAALIEEGATVMTHSRSSTVVAAFERAHVEGRKYRVFATESRPMKEGRTLAEALSRGGLNVTIIADAAAAALMPVTDLVLLGADRVEPESVVNKIGTRMIALAARELGVRVYALCDTSKFVASWPLEAEDDHPGNELWPDAPAGVLIVNRYFEPTPIEHISGVVTENGLLSPREAGKQAAAQQLHPRLLKALARR